MTNLFKNTGVALASGLALGAVATLAAQAASKLKARKPVKVLITGAAGRRVKQWQKGMGPPEGATGATAEVRRT